MTAESDSKAAVQPENNDDDEDMDLDAGFAIEAALAQSSEGEADLSKDTITSLQDGGGDEDVVPDSDPEHTPEYLEPEGSQPADANPDAEDVKPISRVSSLSSLSSINCEESLSGPDFSNDECEPAWFAEGHPWFHGKALSGTSSTPPVGDQHRGRKISDAGSVQSSSTVGSGRAGKQRSNIPDIRVATSPRKRFNKPAATSSIVAAARDKDRKARASTSAASQSTSKRVSMRNDASSSRRERRVKNEDMDVDEDDLGNASASSSSSSAVVVAVSQSSSKRWIRPKSESETDYSQEPGPVPVTKKKTKQKKEEEYIESQELPEQPTTRRSRRSDPEETVVKQEPGKTTRKSSLRNGGTVSPVLSEDEEPKSKKAVKEEKKPEAFVSMSTNLGGEKLKASEILERMRANQMKSMGMEAVKPSTSKPAATGLEHDEELDGPMLLGKKSGSESDEDEDEELEDASVLFAKGKERAKPKALPIIKPPTDTSKYALDKLHKKKQRDEQRGWYGVESAEASFAKHTGEGDLDDIPVRKWPDSDDEDEDEELPDLEKSTSAGKEKRQRRPSDGAMKRVAGALSGNQDALDAVKIANDTFDKAEPKVAAETAAENRSLWNTKHKRRIHPFKPYDADGKEGYDLALRQGIITGLKDPAMFPVELFSFFTISSDAIASSLPITYSLFQLIAHPNTSIRLASKALIVLERILRKLPRLAASDRHEDTDIDMGDVVKGFLDLGAKRDFFAEDLLEAADISEDVLETQDMSAELLPGDDLEESDDGKETYGQDMRTAAAYRILSMLKILLETRQRDSDLLESFALFLVRIPIEGDNDQLQAQATRVLEALFDVLPSNRFLSLRKTLRDYLRTLETRQDQFVILKRLPMYTPPQKALVKTLILACLFGPGFTDEDVLRDPSLGEILAALRSEKTPQPLVTTETYTDREIYYTALILQLLLHDTAHFLLVDAYVKDDALTAKGEAARETVKDIVACLRKSESKMRSHVRSGDPIRDKAKNALTRLQHSLDYQYRAALHASEKTAMRAKFNGVDHKVDSTGQMSLKGFTRAQPRHITPKPALKPDLLVV